MIEIEKKWRIIQGKWKIKKGVISSGKATQPVYPPFNWQFYELEWDRILTNVSCKDYVVSFNLCITDDKTSPPPYDTSYCPGRYYPMALFSYGACAYVRYQDEDKYYRILFSLNEKEVAIYTPKGSIVSVASFPFRKGRIYNIRIEVAGSYLAVEINGRTVLVYHDIWSVSKKGYIGFGANHVEMTIDKIKIEKRFNGTRLWRKTKPGIDLQFRKWQGQEWIFDGEQPLMRLSREITISREDATPYWALAEIRLRPGLEPAGCIQLYWDLYPSQSVRMPFEGRYLTCSFGGKVYSTNFVKNVKISARREKVTISWQAHPPHPDSKIAKTYGKVIISYDAQHDTYVYEVENHLVVPPNTAWGRLEYSNPFPYRVTSPACPDQKEQKLWKSRYEYFVYEAEPGRYYKLPHNHNWGDWHCFLIQGQRCVWLLEPDMNMAIDILKGPLLGGYCLWGWDFHMMHPGIVSCGHPLPTEYEISAHFRVRSTHGEEAGRIFRKAMLPEVIECPGKIDWKERFPVYRHGLNSFSPKDWRDRSMPHGEQRWTCTDKQWDKKIGHNDHYSLRLEGPSTIMTTLGSGQFYGSYDARAYELSGWIRTENVGGNGAYIAYNAQVCGRILRGTNNWTKVKAQLKPPDPQAVISLVVVGHGRAWFDDISLTPLT